MNYKKYIPLFEMSYERAKALGKIEDIAIPLLDHIFKIILFPKAQQYNHWLFDEIYNKMVLKIFDDYSNIKGGKSLKFKDYYIALFLEPFSSVDQHRVVVKKIQKISNIEDNLKPKFNFLKLSEQETMKIYNTLNIFYKELIKQNMENLISKKELDFLVKEYLKNI